MASDAAVPPRRCGVIGDPVEHSLSPVMHRAAYAELGLVWSYDPRPVEGGTLGEMLAGLDGSWRGLSVTAPLKREALELAVSCSPRARAAGGVNTLVRTSYGWAGDNTDLPGAVAAIAERVPTALRTGAVLGAGATAASTGLALVELGAREITVLARDASRAEETVALIAAHESRPAVTVAPMTQVILVDALVSTIPADAQNVDLVQRWRHVPVLFDVVYDPWPTPLVEAASGTVVTGVDLLVHQAVLQFELFTGQPAPLATMRRAAEEALGIAPEVASASDATSASGTVPVGEPTEA